MECLSKDVFFRVSMHNFAVRSALTYRIERGFHFCPPGRSCHPGQHLFAWPTFNDNPNLNITGKVLQCRAD